MLSRKYGVLACRFLIEQAMKKLKPGKTATQATTEYVKGVSGQPGVDPLLDRNGKLSSRAKKRLEGLEHGNVSEKDVADYLDNLYDKLSRGIHHPGLLDNSVGVLDDRAGFFVVGEPVMRASVAIFLLELQQDVRLQDVSVKIPKINYANDMLVTTSELLEGKIRQKDTPPASPAASA